MDNEGQGYGLKHLEVLDWGLLEYGEALVRQKALVEKRIAGSSPDCLVLVEHPPVVTIGRSGSLGDLHVSKDTLGQKGVALYHVDRGGMATFHGPGQLVAYPILKLKEKDLRFYVSASNFQKLGRFLRRRRSPRRCRRQCSELFVHVNDDGVRHLDNPRNPSLTLVYLKTN